MEICGKRRVGGGHDEIVVGRWWGSLSSGAARAQARLGLSEVFGGGSEVIAHHSILDGVFL